MLAREGVRSQRLVQSVLGWTQPHRGFFVGSRPLSQGAGDGDDWFTAPKDDSDRPATPAQRLTQLLRQSSRRVVAGGAPSVSASASAAVHSTVLDFATAPALLRLPRDSTPGEADKPEGCTCVGGIRCIACLHARLRRVNVPLPSVIRSQMDDQAQASHLQNTAVYLTHPGVSFAVASLSNPLLPQAAPVFVPAFIESETVDCPPVNDNPDGAMEMSSVLKKRKLKMNKHKQRKLRRKLRFLKRKLGH